MDRVFAISGPRRIRDYFGIRDDRHPLVCGYGHVKGGFVSGFVERRERTTRVGGFELCGCVLTAIGVFAQIKTAQLIIEDSRVADLDSRGARLDRVADR